MTSDYLGRGSGDLAPNVVGLSGFPRPAAPWVYELAPEMELMDPFQLLADHPDITLLIRRLPDGERGRWYPEAHVIVLDDRLTQAERRCVLTHELVHRARGDVHVHDEVTNARQEKSCHETVARLLIPFASLVAAMRWGRDPGELADELWVDVKTLEARVMSLSELEAQHLRTLLDSSADWSVA